MMHFAYIFLQSAASVCKRHSVFLEIQKVCSLRTCNLWPLLHACFFNPKKGMHWQRVVEPLHNQRPLGLRLSIFSTHPSYAVNLRWNYTWHQWEWYRVTVHLELFTMSLDLQINTLRNGQVFNLQSEGEKKTATDLLMWRIILTAVRSISFAGWTRFV